MGIVVLGMHRSGTSAITKLVNLAGVPLAETEDLRPAKRANPKGYWESERLIQFNDLILREAGGSAWVPPPVDAWHDQPAVGELKSEALQLFNLVHPGRNWVWKDPRTCLTLPFWLDVLPHRPVIVFVFRDPREVAASLVRRDRVRHRYALYLWEHYVRRALIYSSGLPLLTARFERVLKDPVQWTEKCHLFLSQHGVNVVDEVSPSAILSFIDKDLRRQTVSSSSTRNIPLSPSQRELFVTLQELPPTNAQFNPPPLPKCTPGARWSFRRRSFNLRLRRTVRRIFNMIRHLELGHD